MPLSLEQIADALLDPACYPWAPATVDRIETHVSWVYLAGDRVLKLKRPVNLGFVDLRDPETRRRACQSEATLNKRLTDGVYLGVVPVTMHGDAVRVGGDGEALELAVMMRRLPAAWMLDTLILSGTIPGDAARVIADRLIRFHLAAKRCGPSNPSACAQAQARVLLENVEQIIDLQEVPGCQRLLQLLGATVAEGVRALGGTLEKRCADGWVVDGHGDLRADHICLVPGLPAQIFDCIEFSAELRCCDVASDIAFLAMDLRRLGMDELALSIIERCRSAGINLPERLFRLYLAHRALVRVKVGLIESAQGLAGDLGDSIASHIDQATSAALEIRPVLAMVSGLSGSGKSAVAARVSRAFGLETIASDVVREELFPTLAPDDRYRPERVAAVYDEMRRRASMVLDRGRPVLLDATFLNRKERDNTAELARSSGAPVVIIDVLASEETSIRRIKARMASHDSPSDADESIYRRQVDLFEAHPPGVPSGAISVSIDNDVDAPPPLDPVLAAFAQAGVIASAFTPGQQEPGDESLPRPHPPS